MASSVTEFKTLEQAQALVNDLRKIIAAAEATATERESRIAELERSLKRHADCVSELQGEATIAHRWFAARFGDEMYSHTFSVKCAMASRVLFDERERVKVLEAALLGCAEKECGLCGTHSHDKEYASTPVMGDRGKYYHPYLVDPTTGASCSAQIARAALATPASDEANWPHVSAVRKEPSLESRATCRGCGVTYDVKWIGTTCSLCDDRIVRHPVETQAPVEARCMAGSYPSYWKTKLWQGCPWQGTVADIHGPCPQCGERKLAAVGGKDGE